MSKWSLFGTENGLSQANTVKSSGKALASGAGLFSNSADSNTSDSVILQSRNALDEAQIAVNELLNMCKRFPSKPTFKNSDGEAISVDSAIVKAVGPEIARKLNLNVGEMHTDNHHNHNDITVGY